MILSQPSLLSEHSYTLTGIDDERFQASLSVESLEEGEELVHLRLQASSLLTPPVIRLEWKQPIVDVQGVWQPNGYRNRGLAPDWTGGYRSQLTNSAPVVCLFSGSGSNKLTFAFSDTLNAVTCKAGVHEETADFYCSVTLFEALSAPLDSYESTLRVDTRAGAYYSSLEGVSEWWSSMPGMTPMPVPEHARQPMYSTWYSFHQELEPGEIEEQCRLAKAMGCEAIIVDDGWQTANNARGYAYCGDWEVCTDKMPDMKAHVERVHQLGMKYMLWYSVPYIGMHSKAWTPFRDRMLYTVEERGWGVVDPRYPEVRSYLIGIYEQAMLEWGLDGFKLDFIDSFNAPADNKQAYGPGMDYVSVPEAVDRLMSDIAGRLRELKPDVLLEFRQSYVGPYMRKYGNMFRAADCPNDAVENRVRTIDIRLLAGSTAAHADMLMWHPEEAPESAALQLINVLFAVPQISVRLERLPQKHAEMVRYWLRFWKENRSLLLDGRLEPHYPELLYPLVTASNEDKLISVAYGRTVMELQQRKLPDTVMLVNGTRNEGIYADFEGSSDRWRMEIRDCMGDLAEEGELFEVGLRLWNVPPAGTLILNRI
ncbi:glycoside hydrolase family 36 protein [Paenibacillus radicis (ex Gao et al. 2016)]|uniref:Alpha-galactosidase n=1 Tax=Paenibacillus radicis (ex Gao et al. 2016) TaxID=1737354 RepID=A0A917HUB3_9BACL|nr:alpha-galactosidase [Paenibacillus radicis (ex Gao et al. 2016)]GGG89294.1 hypothetical protein GCM10010918_55040 [Paenibacillus radicis (ex Gao et al. 2016)]